MPDDDDAPDERELDLCAGLLFGKDKNMVHYSLAICLFAPSSARNVFNGKYRLLHHPLSARPSHSI